MKTYAATGFVEVGSSMLHLWTSTGRTLTGFPHLCEAVFTASRVFRGFERGDEENVFCV